MDYSSLKLAEVKVVSEKEDQGLRMRYSSSREYENTGSKTSMTVQTRQGKNPQL